jgi:hypothetical protein
LTKTQEVPPEFGITEINSQLSNSLGSNSPSHVKAHAMPVVSTINKTIKAFIVNPPYSIISAVLPGSLNARLPVLGFGARARGFIIAAYFSHQGFARGSYGQFNRDHTVFPCVSGDADIWREIQM